MRLIHVTSCQITSYSLLSCRITSRSITNNKTHIIAGTYVTTICSRSWWSIQKHFHLFSYSTLALQMKILFNYWHFCSFCYLWWDCNLTSHRVTSVSRTDIFVLPKIFHKTFNSHHIELPVVPTNYVILVYCYAPTVSEKAYYGTICTVAFRLTLA